MLETLPIELLRDVTLHAFESPWDIVVMILTSKTMRKRLGDSACFSREALTKRLSPLCFPHHTQCRCCTWIQYIGHLKARHDASIPLLAWLRATVSPIVRDAPWFDTFAGPLWAFPLEAVHSFATGLNSKMMPQIPSYVMKTASLTNYDLQNIFESNVNLGNSTKTNANANRKRYHSTMKASRASTPPSTLSKNPFEKEPMPALKRCDACNRLAMEDILPRGHSCDPSEYAASFVQTSGEWALMQGSQWGNQCRNGSLDLAHKRDPGWRHATGGRCVRHLLDPNIKLANATATSRNGLYSDVANGDDVGNSNGNDNNVLGACAVINNSASPAPRPVHIPLSARAPIEARHILRGYESDSAALDIAQYRDCVYNCVAIIDHDKWAKRVDNTSVPSDDAADNHVHNNNADNDYAINCNNTNDIIGNNSGGVIDDDNNADEKNDGKNNNNNNNVTTSTGVSVDSAYDKTCSSRPPPPPLLGVVVPRITNGIPRDSFVCSDCWMSRVQAPSAKHSHGRGHDVLIDMTTEALSRACGPGVSWPYHIHVFAEHRNDANQLVVMARIADGPFAAYSQDLCFSDAFVAEHFCKMIAA